MRLIDADALNETMYHEAFETDTDMQRWDSGCWIRYKMFEKTLSSAPTIDPKHEIEEIKAQAYAEGFSTALEAILDLLKGETKYENQKLYDEYEEPEINPCRGCDDYDGRGGCKSHGGCGADRSEE